MMARFQLNFKLVIYVGKVELGLSERSKKVFKVFPRFPGGFKGNIWICFGG